MHLQSKKVDRFLSPLIPGKKICKRCYTEVLSLLKDIEVGDESQSSPSTSQSFSQGSSEPNVCDVDRVIQEAGSIMNMILGPGPDLGANPEQGPELVPDPAPEPDAGLDPGCQDESQDLFADEEAASSELSGVSCSQPTGHSSLDDPTFAPSPRDAAIAKVNASLVPLGESPIQKRKLTAERSSYGRTKLQRIEERYEDLMTQAGGSAVIKSKFAEVFLEKTMKALKEKFITSQDSSSKLAVLSIALASMSQRQVLEEFEPVGATEFMVRKTAQLVREQGSIMPTSASKKCRALPDEVINSVKEFYQLDDVSSRLMPGMKDFVSVVKDGVRCHEQKRLVLRTLKELYHNYKEKNPETKVGFSMFAALRPKHCVLAGSSGTHSVCVCKYHQNFKLLLDAANFKQYENLEMLATYKDFIAHVTCDPPTPNCYLNECCPQCPGLESLKMSLKASLEQDYVDQVTYQQWGSTDRCNLQTVTKEADEFVDTLLDQLKALLPHHFISKEQSKYFKSSKEELKDGEVLVICDFAENFTCVIQDAIQSYYWVNTQVTLHPFVAYFKVNNSIMCESFVVISDYMKHSVTAVYAFQRELIEFLKQKVINLKKVIYFSDGAAQQYKNKKHVLNLNYHMRDYGVAGEWHFFATSHGKGPCDGLAGTMKRNAYLASLRKELIRNPRDPVAS